MSCMLVWRYMCTWIALCCSVLSGGDWDWTQGLSMLGKQSTINLHPQCITRCFDGGLRERDIFFQILGWKDRLLKQGSLAKRSRCPGYAESCEWDTRKSTGGYLTSVAENKKLTTRCSHRPGATYCKCFSTPAYPVSPTPLGEIHCHLSYCPLICWSVNGCTKGWYWGCVYTW